MSETKFTPGPWFDDIKDHDEPYQPIIINGRFHRICTIWIDDAPVEGFNREQRANSRLIAAAPDLYNALETLTTYCEIKGIPTDAAYAALSKARGES